MEKATLQMRVLERAVRLLGSERALARYLRVPQPDLFLWLRGADTPPQAAFLSAVDLLIDRGDVSEVNPALRPCSEAPETRLEPSTR